MIRDRLHRWLDGDYDISAFMPASSEEHDLTQEQEKALAREEARRVEQLPETLRISETETRAFRLGYRIVAFACCVTLMVVFMYMTAHITAYGRENPRTGVVARRYIEQGTEETGAVNAVAGMILDYRAFDTLGESHVLFTALLVVMILLKIDPKNMRREYEDYYRIRFEQEYPTEKDPILRYVGTVNGCMILAFGIYILLNGHLGPGGGFSGGAVLGTGLMILASALGDRTVDRMMTERRFRVTAAAALIFYSLAKGFVFVTGAAGLENHIPKGTPGDILSAGLILPLDIAVGAVVACTMYGFYCLFRRGGIGGGEGNA